MISKPKKTYTDKGYESDSFIVNIGHAYYHDGFFNVRVRYSELFGTDLSPIKIQLGENSNNICIGKVNRTANKNGTPRIMAGVKYKNWVQENFSQGEVFKVKLINPEYIILSK